MDLTRTRRQPSPDGHRQDGGYRPDNVRGDQAQGPHHPGCHVPSAVTVLSTPIYSTVQAPFHVPPPCRHNPSRRLIDPAPIEKTSRRPSCGRVILFPLYRNRGSPRRPGAHPTRKAPHTGPRREPATGWPVSSACPYHERRDTRFPYESIATSGEGSRGEPCSFAFTISGAGHASLSWRCDSRRAI